MQESRTDLFLRGERASPTCAEISVIETDVTHCPKQTNKTKKKTTHGMNTITTVASSNYL